MEVIPGSSFWISLEDSRGNRFVSATGCLGHEQNSRRNDRSLSETLYNGCESRRELSEPNTSNYFYSGFFKKTGYEVLYFVADNSGSGRFISLGK